MIELHESGYTLQQVEGSAVTHVIMLDGARVRVCGPKLSEATVKGIIFAAGRTIGRHKIRKL
jgi:hypothetical protein